MVSIFFNVVEIITKFLEHPYNHCFDLLSGSLLFYINLVIFLEIYPVLSFGHISLSPICLHIKTVSLCLFLCIRWIFYVS